MALFGGASRGYPVDMPPKTQREREAEQRKQKLDHIREQVQEGSLVIRQMSDEERRKYARQREDRPQSQSRGAGKSKPRRRRPPLSSR
jgi:hypothetical protein